MPKDIKQPKARKPSQKKAPFHRATPSRNIVFLDNGVVTHRAPLSRQLPTPTGTSDNSASTKEHVTPNAGAHAMGLRSQVSGFPTSYLRSTFNTASPFVQSAPLPSSDAPLRIDTPEPRIQATSEASAATCEPTVFSWHVEGQEDAARGYEGLKLGNRSMRARGASMSVRMSRLISLRRQDLKNPPILRSATNQTPSYPPPSAWRLASRLR